MYSIIYYRDNMAITGFPTKESAYDFIERYLTCAYCNLANFMDKHNIDDGFNNFDMCSAEYGVILTLEEPNIEKIDFHEWFKNRITQSDNMIPIHTLEYFEHYGIKK